MYRHWLFLLLLIPAFATAQNVVINEIVASNQKTIDDEDGDASDYIELYNSGAAAVQLEGYGLSDDPKTVKWHFGTATLAPGEFLLVFASDKNKQGTYWHTNFKISASGESIVLTDAAGVVADRIDVPVSSGDIAWGRTSDGGGAWAFQTPSPGAANTGRIILPYADQVTASPAAGFYSAAVTVTLTAAGNRIYYTLDGSDPDSASALYTGPVTVQKTSVLKAVSVEAGHQPSRCAHSTYFINETSKLPVVSLTSDPANLFDYYTGIYADGPGWTPAAPNYGANYWMDWEKPAHVEFFDDDKKLGISEECGIAIYGAYTRSFPQKSISVKFKSDYGVNGIDYPLFPDLELTRHKAFVLRNSGNDFQYTHFRDAMMQTLVQDLDIDYLEYRPANAFINGEYWGVYNIREKVNEHYIANHHGVDPDNIDMLEGNIEVIHGDTRHYQELIDYLSTQDMKTDAAWEYVNRMIDLDECLLYWAAEVYYNSQDWPANNVKYWRERSENGKWRWILFDLDFGFNLYETTGQSENHLYYLLSGIETRPGSNPPWSTLLPRKLVENPRIRNQFINLLADLLNTNFESTRVVNTINEMASAITPDIARHRKRWGISEKTASDHVKRMITFAQERPGYLRGFVRDFFKCGSPGTLTLTSTAGGRVRLNSLTFTADKLPWTGSYFTSNPIHLTALADPGWKFAGWSGSSASTDTVLSLTVGRNSSLTAAFTAISSGVERQGNALPQRMELLQNYPNPFNPSTTISFVLPEAGPVSLRIHDLLGREIALLLSRTMPAGAHSVQWDAAGAAGGLYICRLEAGGTAQSRKLILMR
ncbi:MAG TPA: CotH kinase family protein [bacterium]|nr:CotH kinase family protein [bacterium]